MAGYITDPLQIINLIADNLRDRYKSGFPVLKEIIQNADDAGSAEEPIQLEFGLSKGIASAEHPLLKGPALYFLNNGAFKESDDTAIRSFGMNRKASEQSSIGKFGLGMKSVFHFCEAFFFLAKNNDREYAEILNPWHGEDSSLFQNHNDWDNFSSSDADLIRAQVQQILNQMDLSRDSFFILWLPLRQKKHLLANGKELGSIIAEFPGDDDHLLSFLFQQELAQKIASLLPLLRRINSIRFWHNNDPGSIASPRFQVSMKGANRIGLADGQYQSKDIEGSILYQPNSKDNASYAMIYSGLEKLIDIPELLSLRNSPLWPKSYVRDDQGKGEPAPDKARGHGAVVFARSNEKEKGVLKISWAVFLPVDAAKEEVPCDGDICYRITLHGYFFVDAGRVAIEGLQDDGKHDNTTVAPQNEAELRRLWNIRLAKQGTLPLFLPALASFVTTAHLSADDIGHLTEGIQKSKLFCRHRESICVHSSWACCLTEKGKEWRLLDRENKMLSLPSPPRSTPERPWLTLPGLKSFQDRGVALLLKDAPHLLGEVLPQWQWREENLREVLDLQVDEVFADQGCLDYLLQFMADPNIKQTLRTNSLQERLQQIANRAFIALGTGLRQHRKKMQEFVSFILPVNRYTLKSDVFPVVCELQQCKTDVLILANEFDSPDAAGTAQLNREDSFTLLKKLNDLIISCEQQDDLDLVKNCRGIAQEILQRLDAEKRRALLATADCLKILEGYDCLQDKLVALSPSDLKDRHESRLLFLYSQGVNDVQRRGLAPKLQRAIRETVVLVKRDTAELVFDKNNDLVPCNADSVLDSLGAQSLSLQSVDFRGQLLPDVAGADLDLQRLRVRGLRYLLHGHEEYFNDEETLWVSGYDQSPVWGKLWQQLPNHHENGWNLLDRKLVEKIPQDKWSKLSIREIKPEDILAELRENGTKGITGEQFSREECDKVLKGLDNDKQLWSELPFHETVNGDLVCIKTGKAFLQTDIVLPEELLQTVDVIKRSKDPAIKRQQEDWIKPLSKENVIQIALHYEKPGKFWRMIMDNLDGETRLLSDPLFRDTPWLLDNNLVAVKPSDVVYLEKMQDEVDRLLAIARGAFWSPGKLCADLQQHPSFALLTEKSFALDQDGFEKLALLLDETSEYHVGRIDLQKDDLERMVPICSHLPVDLNLPGWVLLACAMETSQEMTEEFLLPSILQSIDVERIIALLNWLQEEHIKAGRDAKKDYLTAFNAYLAALVTAESGSGIISRLTLLNREGDWKPASELCSDAEGVADSHLLDDTQKRILEQIVVLADSQKSDLNETMQRLRDLQPEISASADLLEDFFAEWEGLVAPEIICAFLSLLGDDPKMLDLAKRYQGRHSLEWVRDNIPWKIHERTNNQGVRELMYGLNKHEAIAQHRFIVRCSEGQMVQLRSILGAEIAVPLKSQFSSLIIGKLFGECSDVQIKNVRLTLRRPCVEDVSPAELSGFLKSSAEYLLKEAYNQQDFDLGMLWEELDRSEQLDIRIAQQLVLDHVPFYLPQLGVHKHPLLKDLLNHWDEARHKREEYYESGEKEDYDAEVRQVLGKIQELLKNDPQVQQVVLEAVRAKMKHFQYSPASIPFELFQNADDAVVELAMMKAYPKIPDEMGSEILPEHVRRFLVVEEDDSLLIAHWGRPINAFGSAGFSGKGRGFHKDLEKMLVLSSSDKSDEEKVTGKFGLGFKSVLLACERPRLLSGRLTTEIIAGLCPVPLKESAQLRSKLHELSADRRWPGTLVELPLTDITPQEIMQPFERLAGIMTIFSKQIRRIDIHCANNQSLEWKPETLPLNAEACLELGRLPLPNKLNEIKLAAYFRLHDGGILLALGPDGFRVLPDDLPAIWVVAPTKESEGLGFAVNCMFDVDAGRSKLAGNSHVNKEKAHNLGNAFGQALRKLFKLTHTQWDELKTRFRFEQDLSVYDFWTSLWKVIGEGVPQARVSEEVNALVSQLFCGENGLGYLVSHADAMPNGLWNDYQTLTRPKKIRIVLKGSLENACIFKEFVGWEFFRDFLGNPESVTTNAVYAVARKVIPSISQEKGQWQSVQLADVLRSFAETEKEITPATSVTLGRLINHGELKHEDFEKEKELIKKTIHSFIFKTQDDSFHPADEILVSQKHKQANPDEEKRAAFAAEEHVLSHEYQGSGLDFFFACREKITIPVEKMAQWLLDAGTDHQKSHGLRYLLEGEHGEKIADILRKRGLGDTWLAELRTKSACFLGWEELDILEILLRKLLPIEDLSRLYAGSSEIPYDLPEEELQRHDPKEILQRIHTWWVSTKETHLADYERRTYPSGVPCYLGEDDIGRIDRKSWLILFSLAHFHTIGRQRDVQHKGFIETCLQKGWWEIFSKDKPEEHADEWMGVLEDYIDEQVDRSEYELWMNRFPAIYKLSRRLEDYKEAFLSIERAQSLSGISGILNTRVNAEFQGGGISAPPIEKSLGIGACFILRELMRKQIINANHAVPFCYVPVKRTRELCEKIGCRDLSENGGIENSKAIHRFLCGNMGDENADFLNCYDIPLQVLAEKPEVLREILN